MIVGYFSWDKCSGEIGEHLKSQDVVLLASSFFCLLFLSFLPLFLVSLYNIVSIQGESCRDNWAKQTPSSHGACILWGKTTIRKEILKYTCKWVCVCAYVSSNECNVKELMVWRIGISFCFWWAILWSKVLLVFEWRERKMNTDLGRVDWAQYASGINVWSWKPACHVHLNWRMPEGLDWNRERTESGKKNLEWQLAARCKVSKTMKVIQNYILVREIMVEFGAEKQTGPYLNIKRINLAVA